MAETFSLRLLSPAGLAEAIEVEEAILPGFDGEVGILARHTRYVGLLGTGIAVFSMQGKKRRVVLSGGFATFDNNTLEILADYIDDSDSESAKFLRSQKNELEETVRSEIVGSPRWDEASSRLKRLSAIESL